MHKPSKLDLIRATYSSYRHIHSFKCLLGVAPNGTVTYVSRAFPGSISDKKVTKQSGILSQLRAGDVVLADKGFLINDIVPEGVQVNIPPFRENPQFHPQEVINARTIARCRIHVERAIGRMKDFQILHCFPAKLRSHATVIVQLVAVLVNFQAPIIKSS